MIPSQILLHRVALQLAVQRLTIQLHRRYLSALYAADERYKYSVRACIGAAIKILEFQHIFNEETQPDGLLYSVRWMRSSLLQSVFLLGLSVLCYYTQLIKAVDVPSLDRERVLQVLHRVYPIWLQSSTISRDARKVVKHLNLALGYPREQHRNELGAASNNSPLGQGIWDAGQDFVDNIADISQVLDKDLMGWDTGTSSSYNMFLDDWAPESKPAKPTLSRQPLQRATQRIKSSARRNTDPKDSPNDAAVDPNTVDWDSQTTLRIHETGQRGLRC